MSAIPSQLPPIPSSARASGPAPTPAARADFFRAALADIQAGGRTLDAPAPTATAPAPASAVPAERPTRPGALLDIRV